MRPVRALPLLLAVCTTLPASALTAPITGAVALPSSANLLLPFPAGTRIRILSGYSPSGGSSLHDGTNRASYTNDYYALDFVVDGAANSGLGTPVLAQFAGTVVKAGWATQGWANYGQRVILEHDLGDGHIYHVLYAHLNVIDTQLVEGGTVAAGQRLGDLGQSCMGALSCSSFSTPHVHWAIHRDSSIGGSGTGGSYGGNAVVPEPLDGHENTTQGDIIVSTNGLVVRCGDGVCSTGEDHASCPADCPVCEPIPAAGRIVDDNELCFTKGGNAAYWTEAAAGQGGHLWWTTTTSAAAADNNATWALSFAEAGQYRVEANTVAAYSQSVQAPYTIKHAGAQDVVTLNQSAVNGWSLLGVFQFAAGGNQSVRLVDNTGEAYSLGRRISFDAIRLTRVGATVVDAGTPVPDAGAVVVDAGPPRVDAGTSPPDASVDASVTPPPDAGHAPDASARVDAGLPDASATSTTDAGATGVDPDPALPPEDSVDGCACASPQRGAPWAWLALVTAGVRRRRAIHQRAR